MRSSKIRERKPRKPIGRLSGILTGCLAMSIGILNGLDPLVIVWRAFIGAVLVGGIVGIFIDFIRMANVPSDEVSEAR